MLLSTCNFITPTKASAISASPPPNIHAARPPASCLAKPDNNLSSTSLLRSRAVSRALGAGSMERKAGIKVNSSTNAPRMPQAANTPKCRTTEIPAVVNDKKVMIAISPAASITGPTCTSALMTAA